MNESEKKKLKRYGLSGLSKRGRYFLMKGDYKPHPGAVAKAKFKLANHPKG